MVMRLRHLSSGALGLSLCIAASVATGAGWVLPPDFTRAALDRRAPITAERAYDLNAGVRPLLFWIRRDNVGSARLTWRADGQDHRILELLVGSDPDRAPRRINRWGFIAEEVHPPDADLLGIMTQSDEETVAEASSHGTDASGHPYRAIRTAIRGGTASGGVFGLSPRHSLTYRDLETLLESIPKDAAVERVVPMPEGTRPGFLFAVQELITSTIDQCRTASLKQPAALPYIYNNKLYSVRLRTCDFDQEFRIEDHAFSNVIHAELETRNSSTGNRTPFRMTYGTDGDLKAVPLHMVFRPRWWFEAELLLHERG